jgi:hypothetical protein
MANDSEPLSENFYSNLLEEIFFDKKNASCQETEATKPISEAEEDNGYTSSTAATTGSTTTTEASNKTQGCPNRKRKTKKANNNALQKDVKCKKKKRPSPTVPIGNVSTSVGAKDQLTNASCVKYEALRIRYEILRHDMMHLRHRLQLEVEKNQLREPEPEPESDKAKDKNQKRKKRNKEEQGREKEEEEDKKEDWTNVRW